jgi:hypothetical protein
MLTDGIRESHPKSRADPALAVCQMLDGSSERA